MRALTLAGCVALATVVSGGSDPNIVATYPARTGDQALVGGVLVREGDCVYLERGETRNFVLFPAGVTIWNERADGVVFDGALYPIGSEFLAGGGYYSSLEGRLERFPRALRPRLPGSDCDMSEPVYIGSASTRHGDGS